jgi:single-strand DNA-binding protein
MNSLTIIGNITRDPEVRTTKTGKTVCNFWVAVNSKRKDQNGDFITDFFLVSAWNALGENCGRYLAKGRKVAVSGTVSCRAYQTQAGEIRSEMDVLADVVEFLSPLGQNAQPSQAETFTPVQPDDDLPF